VCLDWAACRVLVVYWWLMRRSINTEGLTLLEVLIAIALLSILLAIGVPSMQAARARGSVRDAADRFVSTYSRARSLAIQGGGIAKLRMDDTTGRFWVEVDTTKGTGGVPRTVGSVTYLSDDGVTMTSSQSIVCFTSQGLPTQAWGCPAPNNLTIAFSRNGYADTLNVTAAGKVLRQ